ncbi:MAG: hypothetical protein ABS35_03805, partial [Kaistia sp. SCN 65-12]
MAAELISLFTDEVATGIGQVFVISAIILSRGHLLSLAAVVLNVGLIIWMTLVHRPDLGGPGLGNITDLPSLQLLTFGAGIVFLLHQRWRPTHRRQAIVPAATVLTVPEASVVSRQRYAFDHATDGLAVLDIDGGLLETNLRLRELAGPAGATRPPRRLDDLIHPDDRSSCRRGLERLLADGGGAIEFEARLDRRDGGRFQARITLSLCPDEGGLARHVLAEVRDVTDQHQRLDAGDAFLDLALSAGRLGTWQIDAGRNMVLGSHRFWTILGLPPAGCHPLEALSAVVHPGDWDRFVAYGTAGSAGDPELEIRVRRGNGHLRRVALRACEPHAEGGTPRSGIANDVTYRRERIRLRANARKREGTVLELRHRLCNLFPAVIALVNLMDAPEDDVPGYKQSLIGRIRALEATHQLLARHGTWVAPLRDIVAQELEPYRQVHNLTITGPPIQMSDGAAEGFVMIVHELATNSVKYGALSDANGHLDVTWRFAESPEFAGDVLFEWVESGRRPGIANRGRRGFGSSILGVRGAPLVGRSANM